MDNGGEFTGRLLEAAGVAPAMRVLDLGCGGGVVSLRLAKLVGRDGAVVGVDRDQAALAKARDAAAAHRNVTFVANDLANFALEGELFDAVVGRRVLMYLPDPARTLSAVREVLRSGAIAVFQEHDSATLDGAPMPPLHRRIHNITWRAVKSEGANIHMGFALAPALRSAGFEIAGARVEVTTLTPELDHPIAQIVQAILPRIEASGVATAAEIAPETLAQRLLDERRATGATFAWETMFGVWARA